MRPRPAVAAVRAPVLAMLLLPLLAGCTVESPRLEQGPQPTSAQSPLEGPAGNATNASFDAAPVWELRQWWRYRATSDEGPRADARVVTADQGSAWLVGTDSPETAYFEAQFDISTIGRVRKADLAGEQRGGAVEYYRWPLQPNSTWTTTWDGAPRRIVVVGSEPASVGGRTFPGLALQGFEGEVLRVRYNFVPAVGWFSYAHFLGPDGEFRLDLDAFGRGFNGTIVEARVERAYHDEAGGPLKGTGAFTVPSGMSYLDVQARFEGEFVDYQFGFLAPNGTRPGAIVGPCAGNCSIRVNRTLDAMPGEWKVGTLGTVQGGPQRAAFAMLTVTAVELQRRSLA